MKLLTSECSVKWRWFFRWLANTVEKQGVGGWWTKAGAPRWCFFSLLLHRVESFPNHELVALRPSVYFRKSPGSKVGFSSKVNSSSYLIYGLCKLQSVTRKPSSNHLEEYKLQGCKWYSVKARPRPKKEFLLSCKNKILKFLEQIY